MNMKNSPREVSHNVNFNRIRRIYFLFPVYLVGGGETYVCRIIEYLLLNTSIKVGIIDFDDGMLSRTCKKFFHTQDIHYVNYSHDFWSLDDNSIIFAGADHLGCIKPISAKNIRIQVDVWEAVFGWDILYENRTKCKIARLIKQNNGFSFIDVGCYVAACKQLKQKFRPLYMPLYYYAPKMKYCHRKDLDNEINLVWLGRFAGSKIFAIYNIIDNFAKYKTNRKKIFHLIGNGPLENEVREYSEQYRNEIIFIFTGVLTSTDLVNYLQDNTDVGVAMGTSALNIGALAIPVIMAPQSNKPISIHEYLWLSDMEGGCCGTPLDKHPIFDNMYKKLKSFDYMLDSISDSLQRKQIGEACQSLYSKTYGSLEHCGQKFLESINQSTLTYEKLRKVLKFLPYNDKDGLAVQTISFLGLPLLKIKHHRGKIRYYLFGLEICKTVHFDNKIKIYVLGLPIFKSSWWGRYAFYESTNDKVKKECKNKYAISERISINH